VQLVVGAVGFSFHFIPRPGQRPGPWCLPGWVVGVAGWNAIAPIRGFGFSRRPVWWWGLGTLLGPEGTPVGGCFLVPLLVMVV
jgi:hypothetical protein